MTKTEIIKRKIELKLQYIEFLKDDIFANQLRVGATYKEIEDLEKQLKDGGP